MQFAAAALRHRGGGEVQKAPPPAVLAALFLAIFPFAATGSCRGSVTSLPAPETTGVHKESGEDNEGREPLAALAALFVAIRVLADKKA